MTRLYTNSLRKPSTNLLIAFALLFLVACGGSNTSSLSSPTPRLASVDNFRDVAIGDGTTPYRNITGQTLRQGVIYRSNALSPSEQDLTTLSTLGINTVYDLRSPSEIAKRPDVLPTGAHYFNIAILGDTDPTTIPMVNSPEETIAYMENMYRQFVTDPMQREKFAELLTAIADNDHAQLFHCTAGKDRTGWAAALLLTIAQVPHDVIVHDYLLTNTYTSSSIDATYQMLVGMYGQTIADNAYPALGVQPSFIDAAFEQVVKSYGSMGNYITYGLGISLDTQNRLRDKLLF